MKITQSQLRRIIKEELENVLTEQEAEITPDAAKNAIGAILARMPQGAGIRQQEPMGFLFSGNASVDSAGNVGFQLADEGAHVSPAGGIGTDVNTSTEAVPTSEILRNLFNHRGLAAELKEKGLSIDSGYRTDAKMRFRFRPGGFRNNQFQGYVIEPL